MGSSNKRNRRRHHGSPQRNQEKREAAAAQKRHRHIMTAIKVGSIALVLLVGGVVALSAYNHRLERMYDLTLLGKGVPAVVQVHDPSCPYCRELKANVESIISEFDDDTLIIRFADLQTMHGAAFARRYDAQRVTLLYLDGNGELRGRETGVQTPAQLRQTFERLAAGEL